MSQVSTGNAIRALIGATTRMTVGIAVLTLFNLSAACTQSARPEINVRVGMPVAEFLAQDSAKTVGIDLAADRSDFWGTDDPVTLVVHLPKGVLRLDEDQSLGIIIVSSPGSMSGEIERISRVRSINAPVLGGSMRAPEDIDALTALCGRLSDLLGPEFRFETERSVNLKDTASWTNRKEFEVCSYVSKDRSVAVVLRRYESELRFFSRIYFSEGVD